MGKIQIFVVFSLGHGTDLESGSEDPRGQEASAELQTCPG